jgi:transposase
VRSQYKYYVQLTIEGEKPQKGRKLGKGNVGIDLGPTTVAVSGVNVVSIDKLASKCDDIQEEITRLSRRIDRSRRANNPQNFNEDGTIKRGIKLVWNDSNRYKELRRELAELRRKQAAIRKQQHIERANALLKEGDTFIVENNPISSWTTRAKETKVNEKTGKIQKKKRFGKSVANHAPSMFVSILENKVKSLGGDLVKVDTKNAASQYDFTNNSFTKHELKERNVTLSNGDTHQRDMLAAFNLQHLQYDEKDDKQYDTEAMTADYERFCQLEQEEILRYKNKVKKDDRGTIGAEKL